MIYSYMLYLMLINVCPHRHTAGSCQHVCNKFTAHAAFCWPIHLPYFESALSSLQTAGCHLSAGPVPRLYPVPVWHWSRDAWSTCLYWTNVSFSWRHYEMLSCCKFVFPNTHLLDLSFPSNHGPIVCGQTDDRNSENNM